MINDRDDWLSPAAFVAGVDFEAKPIDPNFVPRSGIAPMNDQDQAFVRAHMAAVIQPAPTDPAPVLVYDPSIDERVPVTQEWVDLAVNRMTEQHREILRLRQDPAAYSQDPCLHHEAPASRHRSALEIIQASLGRNQLMAQSQWLECGDGPKVGSLLRIRVPSDYTVYDGPAPKMENLK
jgi:hypothetical protein